MFWFVVVLSILSPVSFGRTATQVQHFFGGTNCGKESCKESCKEGCNRKASCEEGCEEGCKEGCEEVVFGHSSESLPAVGSSLPAVFLCAERTSPETRSTIFFSGTYIALGSLKKWPDDSDQSSARVTFEADGRPQPECCFMARHFRQRLLKN